MANLEAVREPVNQSEPRRRFPLGRFPPQRPRLLSDGEIRRDAVETSNRTWKRQPRCSGVLTGGGRGIRTHVGREPEAVFKTAAIGH